jgi:hypothetical protein
MHRRFPTLVALVAAIGIALPATLTGTAVADPPVFTPQPMVGSHLFVTDEDTDFWINAVAPADVDRDGDLDVAVIGFFVVYNESVEDILVVFKNDGADESGNWTFTEERVPLGDVAAGASDLAWGDFDADGDPDLAVGSEGATVVYRNDDGTLARQDTTAALPGYEEDSGYTGAYDLRSLTWADIDNDADLDLLVPSVYDVDQFQWSSRLLRNDGAGDGGWTFTDTGASIDPSSNAQSAWADDDGDSDLDLFLNNVDPYTDDGYVKRFQNTPDGFVGEDLLGIKVEYGMADWGDYDADGDLDILVAGNIQEEDGSFTTVGRTYRNDGAGVYTPITIVEGDTGDWLDLHAATWADYDSDGDMDLLVTGNYVGESEIVGKSEIYANDGGTFTPLGVQLPAPISSIGRGGAFTWFDLDNDNDLDYLVAGAYFVPDGNGLVEAQVNLFKNDASGENRRPKAPDGLDTQLTGDGMALAWNAATDDSTPQAELTYDLELRPFGQSFGPSKRDPAPGTLGAVQDWLVNGVGPGTYAWSVRAVDSAYNAGPRASGTFTVKAARKGLKLTAKPVDPPIEIPAGGGSFRYKVGVQNTSAVWKAFELSIILTKPNGKMTTLTRVTGSVAAGQSFRRTLTQAVPAKWASGQYTQTVSLTRVPSPETSRSFTWVKLA